MKKKIKKKTPPKNKETYMAVCPAVDPLWQQAAHARKKKKHADKTRAKKKIGKKKETNKQDTKKKTFCVLFSFEYQSAHCVCVCVCAISSPRKKKEIYGRETV